MAYDELVNRVHSIYKDVLEKKHEGRTEFSYLTAKMPDLVSGEAIKLFSQAFQVVGRRLLDYKQADQAESDGYQSLQVIWQALYLGFVPRVRYLGCRALEQVLGGLEPAVRTILMPAINEPFT
ncbi:hypothetical protein LTR37_020377 [Vermiconidia calcicola]|uniref:Uncharacterized protein n=1 Tax=Vermiconidia calcicola TaxID=1690605 RepID=A0ACC3MBH4_9PEZI|nr:hypothetical protein LTR37_020377 [Vermiconidia calcicola]